MSDSNTIHHVKPNLRRPSMWTCIFLNDDYTPMIFVTQILIEVFNQPKAVAEEITQRVHKEGKAAVGCYPKDIALLKADQTIGVAIAYQFPLQVVPTELKT